MISLVSFHANATGIGWDVWESDLGFAPGLPPGWGCVSTGELHPHFLHQEERIVIELMAKLKASREGSNGESTGPQTLTLHDVKPISDG